MSETRRVFMRNRSLSADSTVERKGWRVIGRLDARTERPAQPSLQLSPIPSQLDERWDATPGEQPAYSDVTAVAPLAHTLTWLAVMTAQFYLAVVIAQIVGMKVAQVFRRGGRNDLPSPSTRVS